MAKPGRKPKNGIAAMSDKERAALYRANKKNEELLETKNIKTQYDIECFALKKANDVYVETINKLL